MIEWVRSDLIFESTPFKHLPFYGYQDGSAYFRGKVKCCRYCLQVLVDLIFKKRVLLMGDCTCLTFEV